MSDNYNLYKLERNVKEMQTQLDKMKHILIESRIHNCRLSGLSIMVEKNDKIIDCAYEISATLNEIYNERYPKEEEDE